MLPACLRPPGSPYTARRRCLPGDDLETPVAVVINAVMLAGQTAHQLMLLLGQQLATQRGVLGAEVNILHA